MDIILLEIFSNNFPYNSSLCLVTNPEVIDHSSNVSAYFNLINFSNYHRLDITALWFGL